MHTADYVIFALLLALMVVVFLRRGRSEPPKWMAKLQRAKPRFALGLGVALLGVFPTDIMTTVTVGLYLAHHGDRFLSRPPVHRPNAPAPRAARNGGAAVRQARRGHAYQRYATGCPPTRGSSMRSSCCCSWVSSSPAFSAEPTAAARTIAFGPSEPPR